ncbi:amino acid adenylation domain-containing protein, partial [Nostoc sp.]
AQEAQQPFDINSDHLLRVKLLRLNAQEHIVLLTMHHIASDGWSIGVLVQELAKLYPAFCYGEASPLTELPIQYVDFAASQRQWLQGQVLESQISYWRQQLENAPKLLELPTDYPRPAIQTFQGATYSFNLSPELCVALNKFSQQQGSTLFMTLLAAFQTLLWRYTGQEDIVVGSPIANRNRAEIEGLIGFFVNTLVLRTNLAGNPRFEELLKRVREVALGAYAHQDLPFELLVGQLQPQRDLSYTPLFQVMFVLQNAPMSALELPGLILSPVESESNTSKFDLTLYMSETESGIVGNLEYNTDLFQEASIYRMVEHLQTLLSGIVVNPQQRLSELPLLSEPEKYQLLQEWNDTQVEYPQQQFIHELFEAQVERTPDAIAVVFEDEQLTYCELNARANQLAHYLRSLGVKPEVLVGICVERSLEMVIGLLAILKAGGAYVALDPNYPQERLGYMLGDSQPRVLLTQQHLGKNLSNHKAQVICIDSDWQLIANENTDNPECNITIDHLAYIIYTSGSTGKPKGAMNTHSGICNRLLWMQDTYQLTAADSVLQKTPFSFDVSVWEFFWTLITGARLVVAKPEGHRDPNYLVNLIRQQQITTLHFVPSMLQVFLEVKKLEKCQSLVRVIASGEALPVQLKQRFFNRLDAQLYNLYGPTEAAVDVTFWQCEDSFSNQTTVPIGRPIANIQIYLLDQYLNPVAVGVIGEVYIGGVGVGRGYLNRPDLTAEKFIPNPFNNKAATRLYKTGDLARYLPSGEIEYIGRIDNQVKIRGFRIELGEIETVITQHPAVRETVVVVRSDLADSQQIVAYVVPHTNEILSISELRSFLESKLPNYMIQAAVVTLSALPLTPNGKIDRKALPAPELTQLSSSNYVSPTTPIENLLVGIWAEILKLDKIGIHDNFFELGGHSLIATRVISQIRQVFSRELPLRCLFEKPTIAGLATEIETANKAGLGIETTKIEPIERSPQLPLSFAQQRLWFLAQLEPDSPFYNIPAAVRLKGELNYKALQQTFNEILCRHEALRTKFQTVEGQAVAIICQGKPLLVPLVDLSQLSSQQQEIEVKQQAFTEAQQPFELTNDLLLRVKLLRLEAREHIVLLTMHHIASDGWSIGVLVQELAKLYPAFCNEQLSPLTKLPIQYVDFAAWQRQWLQAEVLQSQVSYWLKQLEGIPELLELPTDNPRPAIQTFRGATYSFELSNELSVALNKLSQQQGSTLFMTLLAAFQTLLWRYTGQEDIVVGSPIANRNRVEIEGLIGFFVNTLVLRTNLAGNPRFEELLKRVREVALGAYTHQDLPFELLVEQLQPQRDLSHTPLFQVMFVLQNAPMSALELPGLTLSPVESDSHSAKFDLTLSITETNSGLVGNLEYNTDLFAESSIQRMAAHLQTLLSGVVVNPQQRLSQLPLLTEAEKHQLLEQWNDTTVDYPQQLCIHQLFEAQVERTPDVVAVVFEDEQLTYWELNTRANQVANYLQQLGVKPEVLVGICVERSLSMVIGLLAILKAGGAYIPLDPGYPQERLAYMLEDSQASVLLTQASLVDAIPQHKAYIICLDTDWHLIEQQSPENLLCQLTTDNLAYVIYTSGSTGKPKGVMIKHNSTVAMLDWANKTFAIEARKGVLASTSICFDLSVFEVFVPLCCGGQVILIENALYLPTLPAAESVTLINSVPSVISQLARTDSIPASVQIVNIAGEPLHNQLVQQLYQQDKIQQVFNLYGPSEDTTYSTSAQIGKSASNNPPIGRPIYNTQIYLLDNNFQPVPVGVTGMLYVGGAGLARGYLNTVELTAEKFIPNPFGYKLGARLYKTGDLARYLPSGDIEYLGRIDHQVKIHGFRIELGEIEALICQHPAVGETVIVVRSDLADFQRIIAYVVPQKEQTLVIYELRSFLESKLPNYMIPTTFVTLEALPLTPNGKVDRKALPAHDTTRPELEKAFIAPKTTVEKQLAVIWTQVLGLEKVGINDNFFELGGDSILSLQIISKANQVGLHLTPKQLFQHQTIAKLAAVAGTTQKISAEQNLITGSLELTPIEHWFFEQEQPEPHHWNQAVMLKAKQRINPVALEKVVQDLQKHHDALRSRFIKKELSLQAIIVSPNNVIPTIYLDLSALPKDQQVAQMEAMSVQLQASLNLTQGPLFRIAIFDLGVNQQSRLLWVIHHLVVDGVSWRILIEDFQTAYQQICQDKALQLPPKTTSFKQWSSYLQEYAQLPALRSELEYWLAIKQQPVRPIPIDFSYGNNLEESACTLTVSLSEQETQVLLQQVPAVYQTQINDVLLTALVQTFSQWTGETSLLIDLEGHGREELFEDVDLSRTVGWFTTIFPVHLSLDSAFDSPGKALKSIKEQLRTIPNRGIGYGVLRYLREDMEIREQFSRLPKAEVVFNYLGQFDQVLPESYLFSFATESSGPSHSLRNQRNHLLEVNASISQGSLQINWTYSNQFHRQTTVETLAQSFIEALRSLITHCQSSDAGGFTPSDFAEFQQSQWEQTDLDAITSVIGNI